MKLSNVLRATILLLLLVATAGVILASYRAVRSLGRNRTNGSPTMQSSSFVETLELTHFKIRFDSRRVTRAQALDAESLFEEARQKCSNLFGLNPPFQIDVDLTPDIVAFSGRTSW